MMYIAESYINMFVCMYIYVSNTWQSATAANRYVCCTCNNEWRILTAPMSNKTLTTALSHSWEFCGAITNVFICMCAQSTRPTCSSKRSAPPQSQAESENAVNTHATNKCQSLLTCHMTLTWYTCAHILIYIYIYTIYVYMCTLRVY